MRRFTNKKGLSESWLRVAKFYIDSYDKVGWRSATQLIDSPRIALLTERHEDEIVVDISDYIFMILGSAIHGILDAAADHKAITEQRITTKILGKEVSMKADRIEEISDTNPKEYCIVDYKITKVASWQYGPKEAHQAQVNIYNLGYHREMNLNITKARLEMLLRDYSVIDSIKSPHNYPDAEVMPVPIELIDQSSTEEYLEERVKLFMEAEGCTDHNLPFCTDAERWARPEKWAYQKRGAARATRVCTTQAEAQALLDKKSANERSKYEVVHRPGENVRCERYCAVAPWCNQYYAHLNPAF